MSNPLPAFDGVWRAQLKTALLDLLRKRHRDIDRGLQFEGVTFDNPDEKSIATILVLQEIVQNHREFSIVQFPGGVSLVRTAQVDALDAGRRSVNEKAKFIVRGGSDDAKELTESIPTPISYKEDA